MKDDRRRVSFETDYVAAIGLAMFTFARLEWDAIWCIEKMNPGSISTMSDRTAGGIAKELVRLVMARGLPQEDPFIVAANDFQRLVGTRNAIAHGKPGTAPDGGQRLFRDGVAWTIEGLNSAADEFTDCQIRMNDILYGYLGHPKT
jgi:hypothetical protein